MKTSLLILIALLAACGNATQPSARVPELSIVAGADQRDTVARLLPVAVVAQVGNKNTQPGSGVVINWIRANDIPSDWSLSHADSVAIADSTFLGAALTDASGAAMIQLRLSTRAGGQHVVAFAIDADGHRVTHAEAALTAVHDRATVVIGARADTVILALGAPLFDSDSYSSAYDQFGNWAGRLHWQPAAGWRVSADTAWCDTPGLYTMRLALDDVTASLTVRVR